MLEGDSPIPARVLVVDRHPMFREGIKLLLQRDGELHVVAEAGDGPEALEQAAKEQPDLVLLDVDLGECDGLDIIEPLRAIAPRTSVVVLTGVRESDLQERALRRGARGFVGKDQTAAVVVRALRKVLQGELWFDRGTIGSAMTRLLRNESDDRTARTNLTSREREIVRLVGDGLRNGAIAERLTISEKTVRNHLTVIFEKVNVGDRLHLALFAYRHRLARRPD